MRTSSFVHDGACRAEAGAKPAIRFAVLRLFVRELRSDSFWRRWSARRTVAREIKRRLKLAAPPDALY